MEENKNISHEKEKFLLYGNKKTLILARLMPHDNASVSSSASVRAKKSRVSME